jgi:hypothetical protein
MKKLTKQGSVFAPRTDVYSLMPQWPLGPNDRWVEFSPPPPPQCHLCGQPATWKHTRGGLRCDTCPRPKK